MNQNIPYQTRRFFSIILGCNAERVSVVDGNRDEHFAIIPMDGTGKQNRERRHQTLEQLAVNVHRGLPPGEVEIDFNIKEAA